MPEAIAELKEIEYELVLEIMKQNRINKNTLAKITNIPKSTIYHILRNSDNYNKTALENITKIRQVLKVNEELNKIMETMKQHPDEKEKKYIISTFNGEEKIEDFIFNKEMFDKAIEILRALSKYDV
ncbi:MAG: hypothetical protein J5911_01450 [Clostridia bacterium]|nr:hypothetical protein [Clostridia bacterium]